MSVDTVRAIQVSRTVVELHWTADTKPALGFAIGRILDSQPAETQAEIGGDYRSFTDSTVGDLAVGDVLEYSVVDLDLALGIETDPLTVSDPDVPFTHAPPDPAASAPRYTDLETVKRRLRIPASNTEFDADLTEAIIGAEIALDYELGQAFPSTGTNPQYATVPISVSMLCTSAAIAVYKAADAPFGTAGSDDWFGALTIADVASQTIRRSPLIRGLQLSFGIG